MARPLSQIEVPQRNETSMLLQLSESCARHRSRHEKHRISSHPVDDEGDVPKFCQDVINSLRKILPKVEKHYRASTNPHVEDIGHICDFYEQVIEGGFCPHAPHLLKLGKRANDVLPRVHFLFENLLSVSVMEDTTTISRTTTSSKARLFEKICQTVMQLLAMVSDHSILQDIIQDLVELGLDLSLLIQSNIMEESSDQVEITLFDRFLGESVVDDKEEYVLILKNKEHLYMIQSAVTTVLHQLLHFLKEKRLSTSNLIDAMLVDVGNYYGYDDTYFLAPLAERPEILEEVLMLARQILISDTPDSSKEYALYIRSSISALRLLQMMGSDLHDTGSLSPLASLRLHSHILIAQVIKKLLHTQKHSTLSKLEASFMRKLAYCLSRSVQQHAKCSRERSTFLALLLNILQHVRICPGQSKINPARRALEVSVLRSIHMLLLQYRKFGVIEELSLDRDALTHLIGLVQDPDFHEYAIWILSACLLMKRCESNLEDICGQAMHEAESGGADESASSGSKRMLPVNEVMGSKRLKYDNGNFSSLRSNECFENLLRPVVEDLLQLLVYGNQSDQPVGPSADSVKLLGGIRIVLNLAEAAHAPLGPITEKWLSRVLDVAFQFARKIEGSGECPENREVLRSLVCCGLHVSLIRSHRPELFVNVLAMGFPIDSFIKTCEDMYSSLQKDNENGHIEKHPWILDSTFHHGLHFQFIDESGKSCPLASFVVEIFNSSVVRVSFDGCKVVSQELDKVLLSSDQSNESQGKRLGLLISAFKLAPPDSEFTIQEKTCRVMLLLDFQRMSPESKKISLISIQWLVRETSLQDLRRIISQSSRGKALNGSGLLHFVLDCCFSEEDAGIRKTATEIIQFSFTDGGFGLVTCLLSTDEEWMILGSGLRGTENVPQVQILDQLVIRFFRNVDALLHSRCCLPQSQLSLTIGSITSSNSDKSLKRDRIDQLVFHCRSAAKILLSFCTDSDDYFMKRLLHSSLSRVVRLWSGPGSLRNETQWICFVELSRWSCLSMKSRIFNDENMKLFSPNLFREVLVPSSTILTADGRTGIENIRDGSKERQCLLLATFITFFILSGSGHGKSIAAQNHGGVHDIERFLGSVLPYVFSQLVIEKDYDALRLTTSFKLFLLGQKHFESKQRMRVSADGVKINFVFDVSLGSPKSTFITSSLLSRVWKHDLEEQTGFLCSSPELFATLLPLVFTRAGESELNFFTQTVLRNRLKSLTDAIQANERMILKTILLEIGENHYNNDPVLRALKLIDHFRTVSIEPESSKPTSIIYRSFNEKEEGFSRWITKHFMYLVVNVVQFRWRTKSDQEKVQALRSLFFAVRLLDPKESCQYFPQIVATLNAAVALCEERDTRDTEKVLVLAVQILSEFIKLVGESNTELLAQNLKILVVSLVPVLSKSECSHESSARMTSQNVGIEILQRLVHGDLGKRLAPFFSDIPFLPSNEALHGVRESLRSLGVDNDTVISTQGTQDGTSTDQSTHDTSKQEALRQRLATVCPLIAHENAGVRRVALKHIVDLLKANRYLFHAIVENEGDTSMKHYLTVIKSGTSGSSCGTVTELVEAVMNRCLVETDEKTRILLATCIGEVGAIAVDRLEERSERICIVKMEQGPWKSRAARHQLKLVTGQLVTALKAAHSSSDQHKIMFTIQQILALLDRYVSQSNSPDNTTNPGKREMSDWLSAQLSNAGVLDVVEPFWWTEFCESEAVVPLKSPPFFFDASSYFGWMSSWCSYMARRAYESKETEWSELFYACRTALRTPVGLEIAEYLLPILIVDRLCFGDAHDEKMILDEIRSALSFGHGSSSRMIHTERQKVVNTLLDLIETLQRWHEQETESKLAGDTKTVGSHELKANANHFEPKGLAITSLESNWHVDESVLRIDDILTNIPLSLRARAATCVGMHSRALRLFEMVARLHTAKAVFEDTNKKYVSAKQTRSRAAGNCAGSELEYLMETLCSLDDYETLSCLLEDETARTGVSFSWGATKKKEISGDWEGALQDYERAIQLQRTDNNESVHLQKGALRCLLELGHFESVMNQVSGLMGESATGVSDCSIFDEYLPASVEASWRLGDWKSLENLCDSETRRKCVRECPGLTQGDIILELRKGNIDTAMAHITDARRLIMNTLSINASEGYARAFRDVISLHALREIEDVASMVCDDIASRDLGESIAKADLSWDRRLSFVGPVGVSHILDVRLALSRLAGDAVLEGSIFLKMGELARKDGLLGTAANALSQAQAVFRRVKAGNWNGRGITRSSMHLQFAKLKHDCGDCTSALRMLDIGDLDTLVHLGDSDLRLQVHERVDNFLGSDCHGMMDEETVSVFAKSVLQSTRWMIEGGLKGGSEIMSRFRILHQVAPRLEKGHFYFAKYVDSILRSRIIALLRKSPEGRSRESEDILDGFAVAHDKACQRYILLAIKHYVEALVIDIRHVYQALPRLLSLWFEFTSIGNAEQFKNSILEEPTAQAMQVLTQNQEEANAVIATKYKQIPVPAFYTALPQLISRVKHPNTDTTTVVHGILRRVLTKYPAQAMWPLAWLRQSRQRDRQKAGSEIFREAELRLAGTSHNRLHLLLVESKSLFEWLQKLAKFEPKKARCAEIKVTPWKGQIGLEEFIPPVKAALSASFSIGDSDRSRDLFPRHVPRMRAFSPIIKVMQSKARPKILKAQVVSAESVTKSKDRTSSSCFDIGEIHFLVKQEAKGDLRKDARVQELNTVVNRLLISTAGRTVNQRRPLRIRTFAVTCLSEDTGILEWVPDTSSFRSLIGKAYNPQVNTYCPQRRGARLANLGDPMLRREYERCQEMFFVSKNLKGATKMFEEMCLKTNPPLLFWWFVHAFENSNAWYEARTRFTRSSAAWAAIGHVLGVGDRHAENILVDTSSGECVHVDFDCIFDKGLHLPKPEVVPFRLTQNMLDAFGPTGADGIFSDTLYKAMHTLRDNRDTLLSVLEPFLKDPVIDWKRSRSQQQNKSSSGEDHNTKEAKRSINVIDERLRGIYNLRNPNYKRIRRNDTFVDQEDEELTHMLPLSVEGQVHKMIAEATSNENLVQMYIGWMAWL